LGVGFSFQTTQKKKGGKGGCSKKVPCAGEKICEVNTAVVGMPKYLNKVDKAPGAGVKAIGWWVRISNKGKEERGGGDMSAPGSAGKPKEEEQVPKNWPHKLWVFKRGGIAAAKAGNKREINSAERIGQRTRTKQQEPQALRLQNERTSDRTKDK